MIKEFVNIYMEKKDELKAVFKEKRPEEYLDIVKAVITLFYDEDTYECPSPERIHVIDDGDYQGTLVFVIAANGYQPDKYWYVNVGYGSCSGCDTLQGIGGYSEDSVTDSEADEYLTLALHVVQGLKLMDDEEDQP